MLTPPHRSTRLCVQMSRLTASNAASTAASPASATAIHFTTSTSPLEHDEEFGVVDLGNRLDFLQLARTHQSVRGDVAEIGQHQAPRRHRLHRGRIESRRALEKIPTTVFD